MALLRAGVFALAAATVNAQIPAGMVGTWNGPFLWSPAGPWGGPNCTTATCNLTMQIAPAPDGGYYLLHPMGQQLMRVKNGLMEYCFGQVFFSGGQQALPGLAGRVSMVAPFEVASATDNEVVFRWRGPRAPMQQANCTGEACARWSLRLTPAGTLRSTMTESHPIVHFDAELSRTGPADLTHDNLTAAACTRWVSPPLDRWSYQGPVLGLGTRDPGAPTTSNVSAHGCFLLQQSPRRAGPPPQAEPRRSPPLGNGSLARCVLLNEALDVRLRYSPAAMPCMPCDVTFALSANTPDETRSYLAVGFKGRFDSYLPKLLTTDRSDYFGMATSPDALKYKAPLSGTIVLGYPSAGGEGDDGCVRDMVADSYTGSPSDRPGVSVLRNASVERVGARTVVRFTVRMDLAKKEESLDVFAMKFADPHWIGNMRVMWALGAVGRGSCSAPFDYHSYERGLTTLFWPSNAWCPDA